MRNVLHSRYTKIKSCPLNQKDRASQEIIVLQQISVHKKEDKDHVPDLYQITSNTVMKAICISLVWSCYHF